MGVSNHRERVVGGDVSVAIDAYVLRGEAALTIREADDADQPFRKRS